MSTDFEKSLVEAESLCLASGIEGKVDRYKDKLYFDSSQGVSLSIHSEQTRSDGTFRAKVEVWTAGAKRTTFEAMQFNVLHNKTVKLANEIEKRIGTLEFKAAA